MCLYRQIEVYKMIKFENVTKEYIDKSNKVLALDNINFEICDGDFCVIYGESGCGKTTALNLISTIDKPTSGSIIINGQNINNFDEDKKASFRLSNIGYIFQNYLLDEEYTVFENIALPLRIGDCDKNEISKRVNEIAKKINITDIVSKKAEDLSGGQKQKCAIARALINNPSIILADEPTGALDKKSGEEIINLLKMLNNEGKTVILVTHNLSYLKQATKLIHLSDGKICKDNYEDK